MGGTSFDVCLIRDGRPAMSRTIQVEDQPIGVSGVEVQSIGAGGGSIAWIDGGGALRVGPQSAGAQPGPGVLRRRRRASRRSPTPTSCSGYLSPDAFLGGRRTLRADLAEQAVAARVGEPLGPDTAARRGGRHRGRQHEHGRRHPLRLGRARHRPARATRSSPAAAPAALHAARLARQLGMRAVLIPLEASTFCAFGMTVTDVRHDYARVASPTVARLRWLAQLDALFAELEQSRASGCASDGFSDDQIELRALRRRPLPQGQVYEITVPIPTVDAHGDADLATIIENVPRDATTSSSPTRSPTSAVEFLHWRVAAIGKTSEWAQADSVLPETSRAAVPASSRQAYFAELGGMADTPVYRVEELPVGATVTGPAIFESDDHDARDQPGRRAPGAAERQPDRQRASADSAPRGGQRRRRHRPTGGGTRLSRR